MAGVVGVSPDQRLGEEIVAFVSLLPGSEASPAEIIEFARGRLAAHKYPRSERRRLGSAHQRREAGPRAPSAAGPPTEIGDRSGSECQYRPGVTLRVNAGRPGVT